MNFAYLRGLYPAIVVTGPQRSGTTICSQMIAADTGYQYIDETAFDVDDESKFRSAVRLSHVVIQAPALLKAICDDPPRETLIVLMRRTLEEIHASERRVGWDREWAPLELSRFGLTEGDIAATKYAWWAAHCPVRSIEIQYRDLEKHSLWVPDEQRTNFIHKQTKVESR